MITVGVAGGAGYTGGELLRIIINHPEVDIKYVYSTSQAGNPVYATHKDLLGETDLVFSDKLVEVDVLFLCLPHGTLKNFLRREYNLGKHKNRELKHSFRHSMKSSKVIKVDLYTDYLNSKKKP